MIMVNQLRNALVPVTGVSMIDQLDGVAFQVLRIKKVVKSFNFFFSCSSAKSDYTIFP